MTGCDTYIEWRQTEYQTRNWSTNCL